MSASKSAWWISSLTALCLFSSGPVRAGEVPSSSLATSELFLRHDRPLEPPVPAGFLDRLPLTNPNISTMSPTMMSVLSVQDGYWLAIANDLYKISRQGRILSHQIYPFRWYDSLLMVGALASHGDNSFYLLTSNINATWLPSSLLLLDSAGVAEKRWNLDDIVGENAIMAAYERTLVMLDFVPAQSLLFISDEFQYIRRIEFIDEQQLDVNLYTAAVDKLGQHWVGADGNGRNSIESQLFQLTPNATVGSAYAFRPLLDQERPEHHGQIQELVPLPDGGWVVAGLIGYFRESSPWDQRWKYYSFLAELGEDGAVAWAQLYEDFNLVGLKQDGLGGLWGFGNALRNGNDIEAQVIVRFSATGELQWAVERQEAYYFDNIRSGQMAVTPAGGVALGWTTQFYKELWFGVMDSSHPLEGCETFRPFDLADRWLGPVAIEVQPAKIQAVELAPVNLWEEPVELWEGEGDVIEWCPLRSVVYQGERLNPSNRRIE